MTTTLRITLVLFALVLCIASASAPKKRTIEKTTSVAAPYEDTWNAVAGIAVERKWAITTIDKAAGTIVTDWMKLDDASHTDCGVHALASKDRDPKYRVTVRVQKSGAATSVTVDAAFQKIRMFEDAGRQIDCASKGTLESGLFTEVSTRVKLGMIDREKTAAEAAKAPFYCLGTWCSRIEAQCEERRAEGAGSGSGSAAPAACTKAQKAVCFIGLDKDGVQKESCHTTAEECTAQRKAAQMTNPGECT